MYHKFCDDIGIDSTRCHDMNIKIMILMFQKNMDLEKCYLEIWPCNPFLDWNMLDHIRTMKNFKNASAWITLLKFIDISVDDLSWKSFLAKNKLFAHFLQCAQISCLHVGKQNESMNLCHFVQLFLLIHIINLNALNVLEIFFSYNFNRNVKQEAMNFWSAFADILFDKQDRSDVITYLMKNVIKVKDSEFTAELDLEKSKTTKLESIFKQKNLQAINLRPRLRSKLKKELLDESALATLDTFQSWCDKIRFPNVFSQAYKKKFISQCHNVTSMSKQFCHSTLVNLRCARQFYNIRLHLQTLTS